MSPRRLAGPVLIACAAAGGCSEAPAPFVPPDPEPPSGANWRLTFNPGEDRAPTWTPSGDQVIYSAEGFDQLPSTPGVLVGIPFQGGVAEQALLNVQEETGPSRWLTTPSVAPDSSRLAFAQIIFRFDADLCGPPAELACGGPVTEPLFRPLLRTVQLRVRRFDAIGPVSEDAALEVNFQGRVFDETQKPSGLPGTWIVDYYPFHQLDVEEGALVFRPSWSPDGGRIVFSDGLRILIWSFGEGTTLPIPGTDDGTSPAWSPDGERIAFTRLERVDSSTVFCLHLVQGAAGLTPMCAEQRTIYTIGRRIVSVVRPDGLELTNVALGEEPAWSPDGKTLFYRDQDQIWRLDLEGGALTPVPHTEGGREPAVSPDGRYLAFARQASDGTHDIWIVILESEPVP